MSRSRPTRMSEGQLMQHLLGELTCEQAFMMGEVMGIMRKGDDQYIGRLERQVEDLKRVIEQHQRANEEADGGDSQG